MNYISLHFSGLSADAAEMASALLMSIGFEGVEILEDGFTAFINQEQYNLENLDVSVPEWQAHWLCQIEKKIIPPTNWNAEWEKNFEPIQIGNDAYIRAPFHPHKEGVRYEIIIEPKMSFGTGHHATTSMMLEWLLEIELTCKSILDIGTGTGILAILAHKRGASDITATDNDDWSITNALENIAINGSNNIKVVHAGAFKRKAAGYDIVLANIQRSYFEEHLNDISYLLKEGGLLFTSGYLESDIAIVNALAERAGLKPTDVKQREGWVSEMYQKGN